MNDIAKRDSKIDVREVLVGEIVDTAWCPRCGDQHDVTDSVMRCCCGDTHDASFCCQCGHFHGDGTCPQAPCGNYRCCIN